MKRIIVVIIVTVIITAVATYSGTRYIFEQPILNKNVVVRSVNSTILDETRPFLVHLPESYSRDLNRRYPALYVLDGSSQDLHTAKSAGMLSRIGVMPEILVVGIPNVNGTGRQRDYTPPGMRQDIDEPDSPEGQADKFLSFLKHDLIPAIEQDYRTDGRRMLAGNSRGGLFVIYSLIADPSLFDARFAHSPALWRDNDSIIVRLERFLETSREQQGFLFVSLGDAENDKMTRSFRRLTALLQASAPPSLLFQSYFSRGGTHRDNAEISTPVGLHAFFTP